MSFDKSLEDSQKEALLDEKTKLKEPSLYKVVMLNDDYTPMDFVIDVLIKFFGLEFAVAEQTMLTIHKKGKAVCGVYTKDIAETKALEVNKYARDASYPLLCDIEEA